MAQSLICPPNTPQHIRSLCNSLNHVRSGLLYVKNMVEEDVSWDKVRDTVAHEISSAVLHLGNILDSCVIIGGTLHDDPVSKKLLSDFGKIRDFWSRYPPFRPDKVQQDIAIEFQDGSNSGPIIHDIIILVFNMTCEIANGLLDLHAIEQRYRVLYII